MDKGQFECIISQHQRECVFCNPQEALVLFENETFGVLLDPAPLLPGHLVIYSKAHIGCAAEITSTDSYGFVAARTWAIDCVGRRFGPATLYEHGRAGHCLMGRLEERLCHHFHLHCLPGDFDLRAELAGRFEAVTLRHFSDLPEAYEQYGDYLYVEAPSAPPTFFAADETVEPHLLRTLIARRLGAPHLADWSTYLTPSALAESLAAYGPPAYPHAQAPKRW